MKAMSETTRFASRKFLLSVAAFVAGVPMVWFGLMTPDQWINFTTWVLGLYMAGNVGDTAATKTGGP